MKPTKLLTDDTVGPDIRKELMTTLVDVVPRHRALAALTALTFMIGIWVGLLETGGLYALQLAPLAGLIYSGFIFTDQHHDTNPPKNR